jgi:tRNA U34 2-thiouridine synthase MnmA/TrmU
MLEKKAKGIGLLSGGLDSMLAVKVMQEQDLELIGITFVTPFFGPEPGLTVGKITGIAVRVIDIGKQHLRMLKKPFYGYGKQMNPCIDCHALMIQEAGRIMEQEGGDFLFTGEVLGQRPMSQRRDSLKSVEKLSGFPGRVLRPLSARLLPPTIVEQEALVDRNRLLDIHGRGRKRQIALARHYGIKDYPQPGGGCLLTKEGFARKLGVLFSVRTQPDVQEVELLKWGRLFRLPGGNICIIGRDRQDNQNLETLARKEDVVLRVPEYRGPTGIVMTPVGPDVEKDLLMVGRIIVSYSDAPSEELVEVKWEQKGEKGVFSSKKGERDLFESYHI